jgi:L-alanine-DL-glutamate epimerase-like enolase superfamily enzyme
VRAVRRAVGPKIDIMVDASMRYTLDVARRVCNILEEEKIYWLEEPFEPEEIGTYAALRSSVKVPLAAGENEFGLPGFRELLRTGAVDIVQPDASRAGGITECYRIGQLAASLGAKVAPHTWSDAVALTANMHLVAALPNSLTVEVDRTGNPFIDDLLTEPLHIENGVIQLSQAPGLGITLNDEVVERLRMPVGQPLPDGAYSDMSFGQHYDQTPRPFQASESNRS